MGLFSFVNTVTSPFGVKLFKGGPYNGRDSMYNAQDIYAQLAGQGQNMLGSDYLANGGENSLQGQMAKTTRNLVGATNNPQSLSKTQTARVNQMTGDTAKQMNAALSSVRQTLASRGITSGAALAAAEARIRQAYQGQGEAQNTQYTETAHQQNLANIAALLSALTGQYQMGTGLLTGGAGGQMQTGQQLSQEAQQAYQNFFSTLGTLASGGMGGGVPWRVGAASGPAATQGVNNAGFRNLLGLGG